MIIRLSSLALGLLPLASALSPADIPTDTPVSQLIKDASVKLATGNAQDALVYFDVAISRDPQNYLTFFRRGAAYLSLGKAAQAQHDFDRVLELKPGFEGALVQRAKIRARKADWTAARKDYEAAGKTDDVKQLEEAESAALLAQEAVEKGDWENCVTHAGTAIMIAGAAYDIRKTRARCRFEKGEVIEGISDLQHLLQINTGDVEPHLQSSAMAFYSLGETDKGIKHIAQCLQSDPDSKVCMKLRRREKNLEKDLKKVRAHFDKRQFATGSKLLIDRGEEDPGLLKEVKQDFQDYVEMGYIYKNSPQGLYQSLVEMTCEAYIEMNSLKKGAPYCAEALQLNPDSLHGLLHKAQQQLDTDLFEEAVRTLDHAKEHHANSQKIQELLQKAHTLLKRSKTKDYYKVLGVARDADDRDIKKAYRKLSKAYHPDKASANNMTPEDAQKKMAAVNEAYEVLSDEELKARFDRGDDPNSQEQQQNPFQGNPFGNGGGQQFHFRQGGGGGFPGGGNFKFQQGGGFPGGFGF
ncbi:DNAJ domain-containing protein [Dothidotthia symphoricarpi CBS 119687]|uniref:Tetratricopeptide repeat and J domain-containing co-chaperone DNJ1 n=1 Tax=Dothidotthia symphoricarpi CBS 119687 TaxID=1392245 RepID=A0A6A6AGA7_9PLEO|nr:DNAJ domain-containing protein [Dothidotthia symphoricarpi CBS 119687]KAF2130155.1 DNAJ domain-containing protein [Dothidotthia symphoricarpi CBS 119687]